MCPCPTHAAFQWWWDSFELIFSFLIQCFVLFWCHMNTQFNRCWSTEFNIIYTKFHSMTLKLMYGAPQMWGWIWALCFIADTINSQICKADTAHRIWTFILQCHYSFSISAIDQTGKVANWCSDCAYQKLPNSLPILSKHLYERMSKTRYENFAEFNDLSDTK